MAASSIIVVTNALLMRRQNVSPSTPAGLDYIPCSSRQQSVTTSPFAVFLTMIELAVRFVTSRLPSLTVSFARTRTSAPRLLAMIKCMRSSFKSSSVPVRCLCTADGQLLGFAASRGNRIIGNHPAVVAIVTIVVAAVIQWGESNRRKYSGQVLRAFRRYLIFRRRSFPEERTRRDAQFLHVDVSTSEGTADLWRYAKSSRRPIPA